MPISLFGQHDASPGAVAYLHKKLDKHFWGIGCGADNLLTREAYALVEADKVRGNSPGSYWPFDYELQGNECHWGPTFLQYEYAKCMGPVTNSKALVEKCESQGWSGGDFCITWDNGYPTPHFNMEMARDVAENGQARCNEAKEENKKQVLWNTCENTSWDFTDTREVEIFNPDGNWADGSFFIKRTITTHPCASVGNIFQYSNYNFDKISSSKAEDELTPVLEESKTNFVASLIGPMRGAYFYAGGIIGAWLVYLNAKSENLSYGERFKKNFPASIPLIPDYNGGIGGSPS